MRWIRTPFRPPPPGIALYVYHARIDQNDYFSPRNDIMAQVADVRVMIDAGDKQDDPGRTFSSPTLLVAGQKRLGEYGEKPVRFRRIDRSDLTDSKVRFPAIFVVDLKNTRRITEVQRIVTLTRHSDTVFFLHHKGKWSSFMCHHSEVAGKLEEHLEQ